ncbi:MAG: helix-turn-helix domain-containing protein [Actinomycetota bacterium]
MRARSADRSRAVSELAAEIDATQPATSQHLATLRRAGLVTVEVDGRHRRYAANSRHSASCVRSSIDSGTVRSTASSARPSRWTNLQPRPWSVHREAGQP